MNSQAKTVLWIGLILIAIQIVQLWPQVRANIFAPGPGSIPSGQGTTPGSGGGGFFHLPNWPNPFYPGWPYITSYQGTPARNRARA